MQDNTLQPIYCFSSVVVTALKPEFLVAVNAVADEYLAQQSNDMNEIYPAKMSGDFSQDPRLRDFCTFIGKSAWEILRNQGSDMQNANTFFTEMWAQEHHKHSAMEQHVHGNGSQLVGFYFLETPENCSKALFYDPRPGKVQANLPEANMAEITPASNTKPQLVALSAATCGSGLGFQRMARNAPANSPIFVSEVTSVSTLCCRRTACPELDQNVDAATSIPAACANLAPHNPRP